MGIQGYMVMLDLGGDVVSISIHDNERFATKLGALSAPWLQYPGTIRAGSGGPCCRVKAGRRPGGNFLFHRG
ncbi:hypothetical protein GCM10028773_20000 [Spirosoma koreense]